MNGAKCTNPQWKEQASIRKLRRLQPHRAHSVDRRHPGTAARRAAIPIMNYLLPLKGIASMHCSANVGESWRCRHFLRPQAPANHPLHRPGNAAWIIGDDEHG
ncbi:hypothetical protein MJ575_27370 [Klebsiella pneumoniae]|nr:hypothetical protein MJ575_27370 [Klebsiella pneumoniae]